MGFLRQIFGRKRAFGDSKADQVGMYFYVRPKRCDEIVAVRINIHNDLSENEDSSGYFIRKVVRATRCPFEAELHISFDKLRHITQIGVQNGTTVEEAEYQAWVAAKTRLSGS